MSKMWQELGKRLDEHKYEMYDVLIRVERDLDRIFEGTDVQPQQIERVDYLSQLLNSLCTCHDVLNRVERDIDGFR